MGPSYDVFCNLLPSYVKTILTEIPFNNIDTEAWNVAFYCPSDRNAPPRVDALYIDSSGCTAEALTTSLRPLRLKVLHEGMVFCIDDCNILSFGGHIETMAGLGLQFYQGWRILPESGTLVKLDDSPEAGAGLYLFRYQRAKYDPVVHARRFLRELNYFNALEILQAVPDHWFESDEARGIHALEYLMALRVQNRFTGGNFGLEHLAATLYYYNRACTWLPRHHAIYACMATFWRDMNRPDLGRRLLETVSTILDEPSIKEAHASSPTTTPTFPTPELSTYQPETPLRILFLCHPESDFGSDVLHDGLRCVLGPKNVLGYPWKPVLHGQEPEAATGYPCTFHWPEDPVPLEDLAQQAAEGGFDAILYSDTLGTLPRDETRTLLRAATGTPLFVVDMWDECGDSLEAISVRDGLDSVVGYFKREMIQGCSYPEHTWPLLFSYPENRIPPALSWEARKGIFWAGKLMGGARGLQLPWLEKELPLTVQSGTPYTPEAYAACLQEHLMGISLPGNGFDTVRYWELPAHGTLLLSERLPLAIPQDFVDGKHGVFFETVTELRDKAQYYLAHPEEAITIAQAGHAHLLEHHTASARARQCLGQIQQRLGELQ